MGLNIPGDFCPREGENEGLNMPGDLTHGKEKKEVENITVKRLWEPMT